ncbi:hypothetical protein WBG99_33085 [Streptomyces sp. TG1A-60]|uniref:hypothetical protein n=1 Tax=Streptomyces sp. TG1A-60 TaxID=3129111 RepID=UPI0030D5221C
MRRAPVPALVLVPVLCGRATCSFHVGRETGTAYRVRIRAKLPDGTWGGFSAEQTVTTAG